LEKKRHAPTTCTIVQGKNHHLEGKTKEGNLFKLSFFGAGVVISAKHISSAPK
jgi:hypothetical protein